MNLIGGKFYDLFITEKLGEYYLCYCKCNNPLLCTKEQLLNNKIKDCGCNVIKKKTKYIRRASSIRIKHGKSRTRLYRIWSNMKSRCYNSKNQVYKWYGAKGIKVCNDWLDFISFYEWALLSGYKSNLTIERKDINKNYEPANCIWVSKIRNSARLHKKSTSKYIGVSHIGYNSSMKNKLWRAQIKFNGKPITIGHYKTQKEAAIAYNKKSLELRGPTGYQNKL